MSLIAAIDVNRIGTHLGVVDIRRTSGTDSVDSINTYTYVVYDHLEQVARGQVEHRYGDGALRLLAKVMHDAEPHLPKRGPR